MIGSEAVADAIAVYLSFNSTMGWLEGKRSWRSRSSRCFNSTMGWLEVWGLSIHWLPILWFQFHYGMIGSILRPTSSAYHYCFNSTMGWLEGILLLNHLFYEIVSIPLWDDWKGPVGRRPLSRSAVSIPLWDDWKGYVLRERWCPEYVSIPLWDDWKTVWASLSAR